MASTTAAERYGYRCPLCSQAFTRDRQGKGWVRHKARPDARSAARTPDGYCTFELGLKS